MNPHGTVRLAYPTYPQGYVFPNLTSMDLRFGQQGMRCGSHLSLVFSLIFALVWRHRQSLLSEVSKKYMCG